MRIQYKHCPQVRAALGEPTRDDEDEGQQQQGVPPALGQKGKRRKPTQEDVEGK